MSKINFLNFDWVNEMEVPNKEKVHEALKIEKDNDEQKLFFSHITTQEDNQTFKNNDLLIMIAPCTKLKNNDIVLVEIEHEEFKGHLYQLKLFDKIFELRPLSTFLNRETIKGDIESIGDIKISAKALKVIRDIGG
ncbi:hypothetical protein B4W72_10765 [Staphylococcus delphini]|uniref:hypothetical protein n=1 Tax=Staphylococcus delphini TaxID=53344 RepID=UPI000BBC3784|nr:hypothetical protein [Staphylococcus delphini]PCF71422.1 hypothetical protein B4W72_10765 [Staphylococcus delphini]PCF79243.1 hypothetical protein B4W69_13495 [Staphylococcus delphini]